ncbi:MAG: 3'-5' exonuclease [Betaproteobacteria bacterium SG8_41]|nr:MAG: 3'-5' exonuclease [Betaproteobacteria bacterium SG8_41]
MIPVLVFDIETVPDVEGLRRLRGLEPGIPDKEVAEMAFQLRRQTTGSDFLPLYLHRVIAISCALRDRDSFRVWSLGAGAESEGELIQRFFDGVDKYTPQLVSWNGGGFDMPVLHYRGLIHGINARRYWDMGEEDRDFKWNNYISRYHSRHLDLMDLLALYQPRANAPLSELAQLMGLPGKLGMDGAGVWEAYQAGRIAAIRQYCETDVVNAYLVYLRFQMMRGALTREHHGRECELVRTTLKKSNEPHWQEFLAHWRT